MLYAKNSSKFFSFTSRSTAQDQEEIERKDMAIPNVWALLKKRIDILSKSTITLTFTVLTPSRDKRRYRITEKRYRAQNNGPTFVMEILQKMQKLALFCNWREIKSRSTCRSR